MFEVIVDSYLTNGKAVVEVTEDYSKAAKVASGYALFMNRQAIVRRCVDVQKSRAELAEFQRMTA